MLTVPRLVDLVLHLIAYVDKDHVQDVANAMGAVFTANGIENKTYCLEADTTGASII